MYVFERLDPFHCTDKVFWYICTSYIKTFNTKPCLNILKRNLSTWGGGQKLLIILFALFLMMLYSYIKTSGGIGMFFFLRWISKLHYKIHHNITKKYIWIYMQKTVSRQVRLQQASETRNGMVRRTLQTPPFQSHFRVTFNMFMLVYYEINFKTSIN